MRAASALRQRTAGGDDDIDSRPPHGSLFVQPLGTGRVLVMALVVATEATAARHRIGAIAGIICMQNWPAARAPLDFRRWFVVASGPPHPIDNFVCGHAVNDHGSLNYAELTGSTCYCTDRERGGC